MAEAFDEEELRRLAPFFTNVDRPVFGLKLPQEVSGALFSRYSRSAKSLRRVFLDEFAGAELPAATPEADPGSLARARAFYDRVLVGYGDDSVAQLGGAHVAVERVSNVAAKILEDARIGVAFLEKSTRYVRFDQKDAGGEYLFHREEALCASPHRDAYLALMRRLFDTYAAQIDPMIAHIRHLLPIESVEVRHPKTGEPLVFADIAGDAELKKQAERAYQSTVRAHACDVMRSYLPGATLTNLGIFAAGQAYEHLLDRLWSDPLAEARSLAGSLHRELDQLIPSFVKRAKKSDYLVALGAAGRRATARLSAPCPPAEPAPVTLVDFDAEAEEKVLAALLYSFEEGSLAELRHRIAALSAVERRRIADDFFALRRHRRDKPPRAFENVFYTFDLLGNFGLYRDLQRHRLLTQERQAFTTAHGYDTPHEIEETGFKPEFDRCMEEAHALHEKVKGEFPLEAQYVVPFAYRVRWYMKMNLREAVHLCELRSMPQGHPDYRALVQEMWRKIEEVHPALAGVGRFMNRDSYRLGRLQSEMRNEYKKSLLV
jgi:thymidylate synthase ThyX